MSNQYRDLDESEGSVPETEKQWCSICDRAIHPESHAFGGKYVDGLGYICLTCSLKEIDSKEGGQ